MKLSARIREVVDLSQTDRCAMLQLMDRHYVNVLPAEFERDLAEKKWVVQVHNPSGELCGFSTQMVLEAQAAGRPIKALFSGDTIIDRQHWGDTALMQAGGKLALSLAEGSPDAELYWFLISQGYKTYRFLPVFFREFFPRYDAPQQEHLRAVIDALAPAKFPRRYDRSRGVIRAHAEQYRLREGVADIGPERLRDPHVRFFVERNPGHVVGDELCCVARLSRDNFTDAAFRVLGSNS